MSRLNANHNRRSYQATKSLTGSLDSLEEIPQSFRKSIYLSCALAALGGTLCGYDTGCISSIIAMDVFKKRFFDQDTYASQQGVLLVLYLLTAAIGSLFSGYLCDRFSRKYSIVGAALTFCIGVSFQTAGFSYGLLCAGRLITGFGAGLLTNAVNIYHSEISPPDIRGRLISLFTLMSTFGQVLGYLITFGTSQWISDWSWRVPWLLQLISGALFGHFILTLSFSPRWLIDQGRKGEALMVLSELNELDPSHPTVQAVFFEICNEIDFERSLGTRSYGELFQSSNLRRTLIAFFISSSTSFTGSVAVWYFAPQILTNAGLSDVSSSIAATGASGLLSMTATALSLQFLIDRIGRVTLFQLGAASMGASMFIIGVMFARYGILDADGVKVLNSYARNTIIASIYIFTASFAFSYGIASYVYPAEIFSMRCRAKGLSMAYGLNWAFSIIITYSVPLFMSTTVSGVYFFFGTCCLICLIGTSFIPETKGRSLEEMETLFGANGLKHTSPA